MGQMGMEQGLFANDIQLVGDISQAIILEVHAYNYYEKLMELTDNENYRFIISRIQRDEVKHYHWFTMILNMLGVNNPQIPIGELPTNFNDGVRIAIQNEISAEEFYQDIAYRANSHPIQMHFMHAANDEQRHASLLSTILL
jgi:rubrerythrin